MNPGLSRKQREIQERHELILAVARELLLERGYLGLTMDRIAERTEYSKGTIYQHFPNKEEVVMALVIETAQRRARLFDRAATFRGKTRERLAAVGVAAEVFIRLYPDHFQSEQVVRPSSLRDKTSPERQRELELCEHRCMEVATGVVRDAVAQGDLVLPPGVDAQELTYGLWSMSVGAFSLLACEFPLPELGIPRPLEALRRNQHVLLDGYGWRPLAHEYDYQATYTRILTEVFADEVAQLRALDLPAHRDPAHP